MNQNNIQLSKFISLVLRHKPDAANVTVDEGGYVNTNELIEGILDSGRYIDLELLDYIVDTDKKLRYSYNEDKSKIRANQGHSINVDLGLIELEPPNILYHGTSNKFINSIMSEGLIKKERHHVHLSSSIEEAFEVAKRRKNPILLRINSKDMFNNNYSFFTSKNNVWLTNNVPSKYVEIADFKDR